MWKVRVSTEDGGEYELRKSFKSQKAAEDELDDILSGEPSYLDDSQIISGSVEKD